MSRRRSGSGHYDAPTVLGAVLLLALAAVVLLTTTGGGPQLDALRDLLRSAAHTITRIASSAG